MDAVAFAYDVAGEELKRTDRWFWMAAVAGCACLLLAAGCGSSGVFDDADKVVVGLITKTDGNPFFVAMEEGARQRAYELGMELRVYVGEGDGDWESQARAVAELVEDGADGILITPSDPTALGDAVRETREPGALVIALDTPFQQGDIVDGTFATDNLRAGELIGRWARARLEPEGREARIATLDGYPTPVSVDVLRNQGFLKGYGIDVGDAGKIGDEDDARIVGRGVTLGTEEGGRNAMEELIGENPSINLAYAINEPAATGAFAALAELGLTDDVLIVTIDGGCAGVRRVAVGEFGATMMQYPPEMARLGVEAVAEHSRTGKKPENTPGLDFHDTGAALVAGAPVPTVPSLGVAEGLRECWG